MAGAPTGLHVPSLVDAVYAATREKILTGQLAGGSPLTELDLATLYSVARPTAKSALERLVHEGLLRRASNKTARVPVLDSDDIRDIYFSRTLLEREVTMTLAKRQHAPDAAQQTIQALRRVSRTEVARIVDIDVQFHQALVDAIGSSRTNRLYQSLMGEVRLCMTQVMVHRPLSPHRIADEHMSILDAIVAGAPRRASDAVTAHLSSACDRFVDYLDGNNRADDN